MTSTKQITANRHNSSKSTGPTSTEGKTISSGNATRHGILSNRLFLPDEDPLAFQQLYEELSKTFNPADTLEMILVEKIAIAVWKQRRIITAETATITLNRQVPQLFKSINQALEKFYANERVTAENLKPEDPVLISWCESVQKEWDNLVHEEDHEISLEEMKSGAPESWQELQGEAEQGSLSVEAYLQEEGMDVYDWFLQTKEYADAVVSKARLQPKVAELYEAASAELSILADKPRASFERYQATLDNQLYRAIKELRLLQERRMNMVGTIVPASE